MEGNGQAVYGDCHVEGSLARDVVWESIVILLMGRKEDELLTVFVLGRVDIKRPVNTVREGRCHKDDGYTGVHDSSGKS